MKKITEIRWKGEKNVYLDRIIKSRKDRNCSECRNKINDYFILWVELLSEKKKLFRKRDVCLSCDLKIYNQLLTNQKEDYSGKNLIFNGELLKKFKEDYKAELVIEEL